MRFLKSFLREEDAMGTVEIVIILAVLVCIALIFKNTITDFVKDKLGDVLDTGSDIDNNNETDSLY